MGGSRRRTFSRSWRAGPWARSTSRRKACSSRSASASRLAVGVLASGRGTNLQALLDACAAPDFPARIAVVISDRERAAALDRARAAGVEAVWLNPTDYADRERFDLALVRELEKRQ